MNYKNSRALFALFFSILVFSCQKDIDTSLTTQLQDDAKVWQAGEPEQLASGLGQSLGSTIGPAGDLFVPDGLTGSIWRINPKTGDKTVFASGLPSLLGGVGIGGVTDVAFRGGNAYALVTLVHDPNLFPTGAINGIYQIDGPNSFHVIADIGAYNLANPPTGFDFFVSTGVLYSILPYRNGFLVTDGHLNRVFFVTLDGEITLVKQFGNIVPTGLEARGNQIYLAQAGPVPHLPENGKVVSFGINSSSVTNVAAGAPLMVDVEFGQGQTIFGLSQGDFSGDPEGSPALPNTGSLVRINGNGTFSEIADKLDRPTSLEIIKNKAYIVTFTGSVWTVGNIAGPPFGRSHD